MAACGATHYREEEEFFPTRRIDLSFSNAGSSHMPAKKHLRELIVVGKSIPVKRERVKILSERELPEGKTPDGDESDEWDLKADDIERMPTTIFSTATTPRNSKDKQKSAGSLTKVHENKVLEAALRLAKVGAIPQQPKEEDLPVDGRGRRQTLVTTATGKVISKKLATAEELEGCIIAHIFFSTMRGGRNYPPLIISIPKDWPFIKMMRKALAGMQKTINKGERPSHDWIFNYHVNKDKPKIKKELKVLVGDKKVEYRGANLKKKLEAAALEPFVNRFWILPRKAEKNPYYRGKVY